VGLWGCGAVGAWCGQSLEWVDRFILAGESFTQSEAVGLRAKVAKQSERYFKIFHLQNLEVRSTTLATHD